MGSGNFQMIYLLKMVTFKSFICYCKLPQHIKRSWQVTMPVCFASPSRWARAYGLNMSQQCEKEAMVLRNSRWACGIKGKQTWSETTQNTHHPGVENQQVPQLAIDQQKSKKRRLGNSTRVTTINKINTPILVSMICYMNFPFYI